MTWRAGGDGRPVSFGELPWKRPVRCDACDLELARDEAVEVTYDDDGPAAGWLCPECWDSQT